jgi:molybdopterin molybdotransferase
MASPVSVDEHAARIARMLAPLLLTRMTEELPLEQALGRTTADDIRSAVDLPLFRNSQMDGFAVRAADVTAVPIALEVSGDVPAGHAVPVVLTAGTAIRIMTGAPVPSGADAIIPVEDTELVLGRDDDLSGAVVELRRAPEPGDFVRERGSDLHRGEVIVPEGTRLAPRHLAALAAAGVVAVKALARLRVGIVTTGSELVQEGLPAEFGQVFDANGIALAALVEEAGATVSFRGTSDDDTDSFERVLAEAIAVSDLIVTSGGISKGAYEVVREVLQPRGAEVGSVAMQPGGPQATSIIDGVPVLSFPGNPVSTQVSFTVFLRALLRAAAGLPEIATEQAILATPVRSVPGRRQFLRGRRLPDGRVEQASGAGSHLVAGMARSDVLIDLPADAVDLPAGTDVTVWTL